ncbi:MAG: peptidoglycan DD-metalloendopeptidase family protein [Clostridia bacterium]|nr:peptidoglycan DD-metalloendopeptidase family protein [Clostridia bacterium]
MHKSSSVYKAQRIGVHSVIAFLALAALVAAVVILFPHFSLSGRGAHDIAPEQTEAPTTQQPDASSTPETTSVLPVETPLASIEPDASPSPDVYVKTSLVIDGETFASLASRQAAEELIGTAVSHFELLCPGIGLVSEIENRIEYKDAPSGADIISFDEAFSALIAEDSPLRVRTVFTRSDFETLPCSYDAIESDSFYLGTRYVASYGRDGKKMQLHEYTYMNGVLSSLTLLEESVLTEPINDRVLVGTRPIPSGSASRDFGFSECPATDLNFAAPVDADVIGLFGFHDGEFERGIRFNCASGEICYAPCGGTVSAVLLRGNLGLTVEISHGGGIVTRYSNLQSADVLLGDALISGHIIGRIGDGGLHFEFLVDGKPYNPLYYLPLPGSTLG